MRIKLFLSEWWSQIAYWEIPIKCSCMKKRTIDLKQLLTLCSWTQKNSLLCRKFVKASSMFNHWNKNTLFSFFFFPQSYISSADKQFVASTIQAIGRCASNISEVTDTCLAGLVRLLSNRDGKKGIPQFITYSYCCVFVKQRMHDSCLKEKDTEWILKRFNI